MPDCSHGVQRERERRRFALAARTETCYYLCYAYEFDDRVTRQGRRGLLQVSAWQDRSLTEGFLCYIAHGLGVKLNQA